MAKRVAPKRTKRPAASPRRMRVAQEKFTSDLLTRGDAAERGPDGKVPREATHVVTRDVDGTLVVRRVRFKAF